MPRLAAEWSILCITILRVKATLTHDYNPRYTPEKMLRIVQRFTRNGSIIVLHDSLKSCDRMLLALPLIIHWLQSQGYKLESLT